MAPERRPPTLCAQSSPGQVVIAEGQVAIAFSSDLENSVADSRLQRGAAVMSQAIKPMPRFEEPDVDLRRVLVHAREQEAVEIALDDATILDVALLIHRVVVEPGDLTFELFADR